MANGVPHIADLSLARSSIADDPSDTEEYASARSSLPSSSSGDLSTLAPTAEQPDFNPFAASQLSPFKGVAMNGRASPQVTPVHSRNNSLVTSAPSRAPSQSPILSRRWSNLPDEMLASRKLLITDSSTSAVRTKLTPEENMLVDERMLNQFLRATNQNINHTVRRLKDTVAWREAEQPHRLVCTKCLAMQRAHYLHLVGHSDLDQPVIYSCLAMARNHEVAANRLHMLTTFEQAIRAMPPHVEQWIWVCDFHGFGLRDCDPRLAKIFLDVSATHYPERLAVFIIVSPPSVFSVLWRAIQGMVDPATKRKIRFVNFDAPMSSKKNAGIKKELAKYFDEELQNWLLREMAQNRDKKALKKKVYPYGRVNAPEGGPQSVVLDGHDSRGTKDLIKFITASPEVLMPPVEVIK